MKVATRHFSLSINRLSVGRSNVDRTRRFDLKRLVLLAVATAFAAPAYAQVDPQPSYQFLTTGNGFGFQVFDVSQNAITQFLENPYRYLRPNPSNPDGEGVVRRDLAFDTYFGIN